MNLKSRITALEKSQLKEDWLILDCVEAPTCNQLKQMQQAHEKGRIALLFSSRHDWAWSYGLTLRPWMQ